MTEAEKGRQPEVSDLVIDIGACSDREAFEQFGIRRLLKAARRMQQIPETVWL